MAGKPGGEMQRTAGVLTGLRENRRHERLRLDTQIRYRVIQRKAVDAEGGAALQPDGRALNISLCGLAIVTPGPMRQGEYLKIELSLPGRTQPIRALAEVMWSKPEAGMYVSGIRFLILLNQADDATIRRFLERHPDRRGDA